MVLVTLCSFALSVTALADFLLPNYNHTVTVTNRTGQTANDLHCEVLHPITGDDPTAPPFPNESHTVYKMDFDGANVAPGGTVPVTWQSKYRTDAMTSAWWTLNGVKIGSNIKLPNEGIGVNSYSMGGDTVLVTIDNQTGLPIQYFNLQIYNGIPTGPGGTWFDTDQYLAHMVDGFPVPLFVPMDGIFNPGETQIAVLNIMPSDEVYVAGSVGLVDPEFPSDVALIGLGGSGVLIPGDANCDGVADVFDVDAFVLGLTDPLGYETAYPDCSIFTCDANQDGTVDVFDIDAFVALIIGG